MAGPAAKSGLPFPRRYGVYRVVLAAAIVAVAVAFATIQLASDALNSAVAASATLPRAISPWFGLKVYRLLDRIAPAPYVESALARAALARGDADEVERYAVRLPESPVRDELFARAALLRGQDALAIEYFLAAPDPAAIEASAQKLAANDPAAAYALEALLESRLAQTETHPDAVAESYWQMGRFANRQAWREIPGSPLQRAWLRRALSDFEAAVRVAPLSERYVVEAANQANLLDDHVRAKELFSDAVEIDPTSADAVAGLGVIALESGDRSTAELDLMRARRLDSNALMVRALERELR